MKTKDFKNTKGITLIALVVSIVVLLILAGIAIVTLTGENSIINRTISAKNKTQLSEIEEQANLEYTAMLIDQLSGKTSDNVALAAVCTKLKDTYKLPVKLITTEAPTVDKVIFTSDNITKSNENTVGEISIVQGTAATTIAAEAVVTPATGTWYAIVDGKHYKIDIPSGKNRIEIEKTESDVSDANNTPTVKYSSNNAKVTVDEDTGVISVANDATGTAQITATAGGKSAICTVKVKVQVTLTLNANGGAFSDDSTSKIVIGYSEDIATLPTAPTRESYIFTGWYTAASNGTKKYDADATTGALPESTTTYYAQWSEVSYFGTPSRVGEYGYKITGYTATSYSGVWRLFFQDSDYTYIIADPETTLYKPSDYYSSAATGASVSKEGQNLNFKLKNTGTFFIPSNSNNSIKATAWLTDTSSTSKWTNEYKDTGTNAIAEYAIGGPTIEMFLASFKATHTSSNVSVGLGAYGYTCSGLTSKNSLGTAGNYHGIYRYNSNDNKRYWWLASPFDGDNNNEWDVVSSNGYLIGNNVTTGNAGVRPVVCILTSTFDARVASGTITLTDVE